MGLEDFSYNEAWINASSGSVEVSEIFKEAIKKAAAWVQRVQKDEQKAKKFDSILAHFLTQIIRNQKYDFILEKLFKTLDAWFSSNFLLGLLSLIYLPISDKIRELSEKTPIEFDYTKTFEIIEFNDSSLDESLKQRINFWLEDIVDILSIEYSSIQMQHLKTLFNQKELYSELILFTSSIFQFFFYELNIQMTENTSQSYCEFILSQIHNKILEIKIYNI